MKIIALFSLAAAVLSAPAHAGVNVGVSIGINAPGQYGRVDIDNYPRPALVLPQPVLQLPSPVAAHQRPIYLYVPVAHQARWSRYCGRYKACGQPVYFVQEAWVRDEYQRAHPPAHAQDRGKGHKAKGHDEGQRRGHGRGHDKHGD